MQVERPRQGPFHLERPNRVTQAGSTVGPRVARCSGRPVPDRTARAEVGVLPSASLFEAIRIAHAVGGQPAELAPRWRWEGFESNRISGRAGQ